MKIGRNDKCPCGSGIKFKKCCLNRVDDEKYADPANFINIYRETRKDSRIKQCLHPITSECSERIIGAHSIQNNKILKRIATNGYVYMPCPKGGNPFETMTKWGRKEATVFTGFCGYHDNEVFKPIENENFNKRDYHIFLYIYRCFAVEYHKKMEVVKMQQLLIKKMPSKLVGIKDSFKGFELAISDLDECKKEFDKALIDKKYNLLTSIVWEFDIPIKFAASGFTSLERDIEGKIIQDVTNINEEMKHVFISIFPEEDKTYCILAWLKRNDYIFQKYKEQLNMLNIDERKSYLNNFIPMVTENITINPEAWDGLEKYKKDEFSMLIYGIADFLNLENSDEYFNMLESPTFDLFAL